MNHIRMWPLVRSTATTAKHGLGRGPGLIRGQHRTTYIRTTYEQLLRYFGSRPFRRSDFADARTTVRQPSDNFVLSVMLGLSKTAGITIEAFDRVGCQERGRQSALGVAGTVFGLLGALKWPTGESLEGLNSGERAARHAVPNSGLKERISTRAGAIGVDMFAWPSSGGPAGSEFGQAQNARNRQSQATVSPTSTLMRPKLNQVGQLWPCWPTAAPCSASAATLGRRRIQAGQPLARFAESRAPGQPLRNCRTMLGLSPSSPGVTSNCLLTLP